MPNKIVEIYDEEELDEQLATSDCIVFFNDNTNDDCIRIRYYFENLVLEFDALDFLIFDMKSSDTLALKYQVSKVPLIRLYKDNELVNELHTTHPEDIRLFLEQYEKSLPSYEQCVNFTQSFGVL